jgi:hypothetical protein
VSEFAGTAAVAAVDVAARDDPEADAAPDRHREEVLRVPAAAVEAFGDRQGVDVVVDEHRHVEALLEDRRKRDLVPAEKRRLDGAALRVDDTRDTESDAEHRHRAPGCPPGEQVDEAVESVGRGGVERRLVALDHIRVQVDADADDVVRRDLRTEGARRIADDLEEESRPASRGLRPLRHANEALIEELARDGCDRCRAQVEPARDRGASDGSGGPDHPEDRCAIHVAGQADAGHRVHSLRSKFIPRRKSSAHE